ncbi:MAG TPA: MFS transporter, partial [Burkholderiaceae bacterium]|nr:MFS transporter [Burkholderiaceae bacterium]
TRLGHGYSVHGITGSLGWAAAPIFVVSIARLTDWRVALASAALLGAIVLLILFLYRDRLECGRKAHAAASPGPARDTFTFLRLPAVWTCFLFFFAYAVSLSAMQTFAPAAARLLHDVPVALAAVSLSIYMATAAGGMMIGGFLLADPARSERLVAAGFGIAAVVALLIGLGHWPAYVVLVMFGVMGLGAGIAGPSRDLLVKQATPENATGRVYGVVYSGLDVGAALAPAIFGALMDQRLPAGVFMGMALFQGLMIVSAINVKRFGRLRPAKAATA